MRQRCDFIVDEDALSPSTNYRDESFQSVTCTGTDNQTRSPRQNKVVLCNQSGPSEQH